jgi:hypothetical protein
MSLAHPSHENRYPITPGCGVSSLRMPKVKSWSLSQGTFSSPVALSLWVLGSVHVRSKSGTPAYGNPTALESANAIGRCWASRTAPTDLPHGLLEAAVEAFSVTDEDPLVNIAGRKLAIHVLP